MELKGKVGANMKKGPEVSASAKIRAQQKI